jgi:acetaldehyde dehydrogenase (acetylating)
MDTDLESIQEARRLLTAAHDAWKTFAEFSADQVDRILAEISKTAIENAETLARMAVEETGFGTVEHKTAKNLFCADNVYQAIRPLKTVGIVREDAAKKVLEVASPVGVIAGIIPSTNPTSTTIYKALIALKGRNAIVFSPHPSAVGCISETARIIAEAAQRAGAPAGVVACMRTPSMEGTQELMKNRRTAVILATGGPGLVRAAYSAGKPAFGVGPGNVPAYIERSADVPRAVGHILTGKCFDNGTLCSSEQSVICDEEIKDLVLEELGKQGAYICGPEDKVRLERTIQSPLQTLNTKIVGQSAMRIAEMAGITVPAGTRALVGIADGVGRDHPLSMEKLSPVLAFYTVRDWKEGCQKCIDILNFGGLGHTLGLHSNDDQVIREFALHKPASRICVNTPAALGAVGYTTNLFPAMTLGCGSFGGNITSDNISPLHLINLKRVAFGVREVEPVPPKEPAPRRTPPPQPSVNGGQNRELIAGIVDQWLEKKNTSTPVAVRANEPVAGPSAPPLESFKHLEAPARHEESDESPQPVPFVCEDDVRKAASANGSIPVGTKTIITPSARDLGNALDIFITID